MASAKVSQICICEFLPFLPFWFLKRGGGGGGPICPFLTLLSPIVTLTLSKVRKKNQEKREEKNQIPLESESATVFEINTQQKCGGKQVIHDGA